MALEETHATYHVQHAVPPRCPFSSLSPIASIHPDVQEGRSNKWGWREAREEKAPSSWCEHSHLLSQRLQLVSQKQVLFIKHKTRDVLARKVEAKNQEMLSCLFVVFFFSCPFYILRESTATALIKGTWFLLIRIISIVVICYHDYSIVLPLSTEHCW